VLLLVWMVADVVIREVGAGIPVKLHARQTRETAASGEAIFLSTNHGLSKHEHMATIKAIEGRSVHQIQSGQVIVDLKSVIKELVENSLDAGASSIEVRFKNYGLDCIDVQDNGNGISPDDYGSLALKHHTSKLSSYEDLASLDTFGFRGEALSSLCAVSNFHVVTARAEDGAVGKRLEFEHSGVFKGATVTAAQKGTTVTVEKLFHNLPVRRKELEKNIKREYGKVIELLHAYACIAIGVRFSVSNQPPKGNKVAVFSTRGNGTTKENIVNVFGAKTLLALIKLDLRLELEPSKGSLTQDVHNCSKEVLVQGHISKPVFGEGRQAPDRQMVFVNSRPCSLPQVSKAMNEVYKSFNVSQSPFIFANLIMDTTGYDVNVSPDKRVIMLHDQAALLESLKTSLIDLFEQTEQSVPQSIFPNKKMPGYQPLTITKRELSHTAKSETDDVQDEDNADKSKLKRLKPVAREPITECSAEGMHSGLIQNWTNGDVESGESVKISEKMIIGLPKDGLNHGNTKQKCGAVMARANNEEATSEAESFSIPSGEPHTHTNGMETGRDENSVQGRFAKTVDAVSPVLGLDANSKSAPFHDADVSQLHVEEPNLMNTEYKDLFAQRLRHIQKSLGKSVASVSESQPGSDTDEVARVQTLPRESPVPAVAIGSQKVPPGPITNAFDRMRPKRSSVQTAEITVGNTTTRTTFGGNPSYKRRRIHQPKNSQAIARFGGSPLLTRGLKSFAAPGSQMEGDSSDISSYESQDDASGRSDDEGTSDAIEQQVNEPEQLIITAPSNDRTSDPLGDILADAIEDGEPDEIYIDAREHQAQEAQRVAELIRDVEEASARPTEANLKRASHVLKSGGNRKASTLQLLRILNVTMGDVAKRAALLQERMNDFANKAESRTRYNAVVKDEINDAQAESRLSLTVNKSDFERMSIIGQFNLGFIIAVRPALSHQHDDELFIIDQHAADEKYNYERLQRTVTLESQRLVRPKPIELTAVQEEIILGHSDALKANGFEVEMASRMNDDAGDSGSFGHHCRLLTLPISGDKTFDPGDFEELVHLLSEAPPGSSEIPRPKKVQRILAMRACRSSIMVGKTLTHNQMQKVVKHMGEMEKPWNCPHGRPTMRHLAGLGAWRGWREGEAVDLDELSVDGGWYESTNWETWLDGQR